MIAPTLDPVAVQAVLTTAAVSGLLALKHYLADFVLQTNAMARGKERAQGWLVPLCAHGLCHAGIALAIALALAPRLWWLALLDLAIHLAIDRAKAVIAHRGRWPMSDPRFWWLMGFDQFLHQSTNVGLAAAFVLA